VAPASVNGNRYAEQTNACSSNRQGAYLYVESLEKVFTQLRDLAP